MTWVNYNVVRIIWMIFQSFINHYKEFKEAVADFDRRMATIICQGFDDCSGLESAFKVELCVDIELSNTKLLKSHVNSYRSSVFAFVILKTGVLRIKKGWITSSFEFCLTHQKTMRSLKWPDILPYIALQKLFKSDRSKGFSLLTFKSRLFYQTTWENL